MRKLSIKIPDVLFSKRDEDDPDIETIDQIKELTSLAISFGAKAVVVPETDYVYYTNIDFDRLENIGYTKEEFLPILLSSGCDLQIAGIYRIPDNEESVIGDHVLTTEGFKYFSSGSRWYSEFQIPAQQAGYEFVDELPWPEDG